MAIVIDIGTGGSEPKVSRLEGALDRLQEAIDRVADSFAAMSSKASQAAGSAQRAASAASRVKAPPITDPDAAVGSASLRARVMAGDPAAVRAFNQARAMQNARRRAQNAVDPQPESLEDMIQKALLRTRFGKGFGGAMRGMPLGVDIAKILKAGGGSQLGRLFGPFGGGGAGGAAVGGASATLPLTVGLALAAVTVATFVAAVSAAEKNLGRLADASAMGGPKGAAVAARTGLSGRGFQGNISSGAGMQYAVGLGINYLSDPRFGDLDFNKKLATGLKAVLTESNEDLARRMAVAFGIEQALSLRASQFRGGVKNAFVDPGASQTRGYADFAVGRLRAGTVVERAVNAVAAPVLARVGEFLNTVALAGEKVPWEQASDAFDKITRGMYLAAMGPFGAFIEGLSKIAGGDKEKSHDKAMNEHARALDDHRKVIGGPRAGSAVPEGLKQNALREAMQSDRVKFGGL